MSDKKDGVLGELKKWLEFEDTPESEALDAGSELEALKEELAMESDPKKREVLKQRIKELEIDETANTPTEIIGEY